MKCWQGYRLLHPSIPRSLLLGLLIIPSIGPLIPGLGLRPALGETRLSPAAKLPTAKLPTAKLPTAKLNVLARSTPAPVIPPLDIPKLKASLDREDLADAINQVEVGWKAQYEAFYEGKLSSQLLNLEQIQTRLNQLTPQTKTKTALLYAIPLPDRLDIILVTPQGKPIHRSIPTATLKARNQVAAQFRLGVVNPLTESQEYLPAAQQLYQWLIEPVAQDLKQQEIGTILFCLGTGLRGLPLAALHDGQQYLIEKYNLGVIPAFNLLDHRPNNLQGLQVLAMGSAKFATAPPLPAVPIELQSVTQSVGQGKQLLNEDFTLENLQKARSQQPFGIVHIATHAVISAHSAQDSYLQLWDQPLRLTDIRELNLRVPVVQLLVLSACQTALGAPNAELGFAGLAVQSGAKATIASLWAVDDTATLVLMRHLYDRLKQAPIKSAALRQAQLAMLKPTASDPLKLNQTLSFSSPLASRTGDQPLSLASLPTLAQTDFSHPYYWAAFTVIGNPW
ncbi:CHAT domain-containing protein [Alkalinema sp. FACHB-956]|uniref:CHAT domain-containing protein n=1 Tax=Alkalinema sp. FACHB-956 TaxID=2692768 RepID=UPI0016822F6F|nr:CHAT domain-containing protein [Alkalinema sp. FACHB-956]MBD2327529.1 CHAT domain-containing protein [Alkalinema sp. FACHB-956]